MQEILSMNYEWLRALHIISIICWMAGLLYLPRLFVYHAGADKGCDLSETFKTMERRLYKFIMNPAMGASWLFGLLMIWANPAMLQGQGWLHAKLLLVVFMTGAHHVMGKYVRLFAADENTKSDKFFRILNEIPTVLMLLIVILAVVQPF